MQLQLFGEIGIVLTYKEIGHKLKVGDKGKPFFVGYIMQVTCTICITPAQKGSKSALT